MHGHLAELMNQHVLWDRAGIAGQVIIELGRAETYLLRCSRAQSGMWSNGVTFELEIQITVVSHYYEV